MALTAAVLCHAAVFGSAAPTSYFLAVGAAVGLMNIGLALESHEALTLGSLVAAIAALAVPWVPALAAGHTLEDMVELNLIWPQCLVLLFSSRLITELNRLRFVAFWRHLNGRPPGAQSFCSALLLGLSLTLVFYAAIGAADGTPAHDPIGVLRRALAARSPLHAAIVVVFMTVGAALLDVVLALWRERLDLDALRRSVEDGSNVSGQLGEVLTALPAHSRIRAVAFDALFPSSCGTVQSPIEAIHRASRRFIRTLLSFLPLLGFLGTVIGLAIAIAGLDSQGGQQNGANLGQSLAGLGLQFETTLLGLLGGLLASLGVALVDKWEAELLAAARHIVLVSRARSPA
ncbi:MotA/TolQ/ExbB proton channel family protein [Rhizobium oryzicola]|uniref:MotA/TolQ/ExbB proton channel family protein n=1 Tax=Rhizobium oryzicola TaxID=1232668 RepID=A0ABT8SZ01_9HYPH|nr:MotA/TolQ/ExbB proton channel family protein [Rhizobium oryzicola]MDO1583206.1 MotA/TolQ/ExbB proton channel family protein [Rhizobium oryzicola]